jgi:hypothetical protein
MKHSGASRSDLWTAAMGNLCCCVQVDQSTVAIREQFGKFDSVLEPGCHCMPWFMGKRVAGHLTLRLQQLDVRCETKTKVRINTVEINGCIAALFSLFFYYSGMILFQHQFKIMKLMPCSFWL